jgi:hypothetical protein
MKKTVKKLVLSKETVIHLQENLEKVAGGNSHDCWSDYRTCATCNNNTCGTNLC